jgi:hypothetical protein
VFLTLSIVDGKPRLDIDGWHWREADPETDELINLAVVIRDAVDNGDLDEGFAETRTILGIGGLPRGVSDAPQDNGRRNTKRGLRAVYVNPGEDGPLSVTKVAEAPIEYLTEVSSINPTAQKD